MKRTTGWIAIGLLGCLACGGGGGGGEGSIDAGGGSSTDGEGAINGTIDGRSWPIMSAISAVVAQDGGEFALVLFSTKPDLCDRLTANEAYANEQLMMVALADAEMEGSDYVGSAPAAPGTYTVVPVSGTGSAPPPHVAGLEVQNILDGSCNSLEDTDDEAMSGTLDLTAVSDERYTATFDAMFTSDHVTGNFASTACPALGPLYTGATQPSGSATCLQ